MNYDPFFLGHCEIVKMDKVSIIMPVFNAEEFLDASIGSVIAQTYDNWELLICDDQSSDNSVNIAKKQANKDSRIKILSNKRMAGAAGARNTCLEEASGRYIAFLDADDEWLPNKLEVQLKFIVENKFPFVFGYCDNMSEKGELLSTTKAPEAVSLRKIFLSNFIPCLTVIYDTNIFGKIEQPDIKKRNDYALWLRILGKNRDVEARCYPGVVARYRVNGYGLSANKLSGIKYFYRCLRQHAGLGIEAASFLTFSAIGFKALKTLSPQMYNLVVTKLL